MSGPVRGVRGKLTVGGNAIICGAWDVAEPRQMTTEQALLAAIVAQPAEDTLRLVYADWLAENGQEDRSELIRVQVALAKAGPPHKDVMHPEHPTVIHRHGERQYWFTGFVDEGFVVGDRIDILVHRALRKPRMVYGFRVYGINPEEGQYSNELKVLVRLDAESGPWVGTALKDRERTLLAACPEWSRLVCSECDGGTVVARGATCRTCGGTGDLLMRGWFAPGGTLNRMPRNPVWSRGFISSVTATSAECWHGTPETPTPWALAVVKALPLLTEIRVSDRLPYQMRYAEPEVDQWRWWCFRNPLEAPPDYHSALLPECLYEPLRAIHPFPTADAANVALARCVATWVRSHLPKESR
jgi:uncharacterized protein (TIGR02996 family)